MASSAHKLSDLQVRPYSAADRQSVRRIALATALTGRPSSIFFDGDDFLADALTGYFTDYEPESSFVADMQGEVVGYIIGAKDAQVMDRVFNKRLLFPLVKKAWSQGLLLRKKNLLLLWQIFLGAVNGRFIMPDFYTQYPAILHINILTDMRGAGTGAKLINIYLDYLRGLHVPGVHLATMSESAGAFFTAQGFQLLYRSSRPYFRHIHGQDVPLLIYGQLLG